MPETRSDLSLNRMSDDKKPVAADLTQRVVELESLIMHLQYTLGQLDEVVISQQRQIDLLERRVVAASKQLAAVATSGAEERPLAEDKPPHY